ncbi:MAG TPA: Ig-like domain-containing protein [Thermoanaerobaculia bacterium]
MRFPRPICVLLTLTLAACSSKPASLEVSPKKIKIFGIDRGQRLTVRILDRKGQPVEGSVPTFNSSKADVAMVDSSGRVVAKAEGKALVTVSFQKLSTQIPVEVTDVKLIEVSPASVQLIGPVGTQFPIQAIAKNSKDKPVEIKPTWSSPQPAVATISADGLVTSVAPGVVTLVAKVGDVEAACEVRVTVRPLARLEVHPATAIVRTGESQKFDVVGFGPDGKPIEGLNAVFQSSDAAVASVDTQGKATGVGSGAAIIRASIGQVRAEATLIVN